jgi:hypothetical protein
VIALSRQQWEAIAAELIVAGKPWPPEAVDADLVYWGEGRPGRPTLQRRWAWTERATRGRIERRTG